MLIDVRRLLITSLPVCILLAGAAGVGCAKPTCEEAALGGVKAADVAPILERKAKALQEAVKTGDPQKVTDPVIDLLALPEKVEAWFTTTFDPQLAPALATEWNDNVFRRLGDLAPAFKSANQSGQTEVKVTFVCKESSDGATALQKAALAVMKSSAVLYTVNLVKPGESTGTTVGSFAIVANHLALVGKMARVSGSAETPAPPPPNPATPPTPAAPAPAAPSAAPAAVDPSVRQHPTAPARAPVKKPKRR